MYTYKRKKRRYVYEYIYTYVGGEMVVVGGNSEGAEMDGLQLLKDVVSDNAGGRVIGITLMMLLSCMLSTLMLNITYYM
jgi:hypothetical protein